MYRLKAIFALMLVVVFALTACGSPAAPATPTPNSADPAPVTPTSWAEQYLFVDRTVDELYELALQEGRVVWYSISSRSANIAESFMAQYPGIIVEVYDLRNNEMIERFGREYAAGIRNVDLLHLKDQDGTMWFEFVQTGMVHNYFPADIVATIDQMYMNYAMPIYIELNQWFYNTEVFPDGPPITSWWDVTRPEWHGRVMLRDPLGDIDYLAQLTTIVKHSDEMAADYERVFGQPITLHTESPTAGHEFIRRLVANNPILTTSSGEIITAVGTPGQTNPPIGLAASSGLRRREERGYTLDIVNITPATGIPNLNVIYIADEAPNPNAARLLLRWIMGEADGQGEGFQPFNTLGGWPVRSNTAPVEGSMPLSDLTLWEHDVEFIYHNIHDVADFWLSLQ